MTAQQIRAAATILLIVAVAIGWYFGGKSRDEGEAICAKHDEQYVRRFPTYVLCKQFTGIVIMRSE